MENQKCFKLVTNRDIYYEFSTYCEKNEIEQFSIEDYWDYVAYCEMNNFLYDFIELDNY
ncbi:MAG: hypothetical protein ACRCX8_07280 [Sarcina sp.]